MLNSSTASSPARQGSTKPTQLQLLPLLVPPLQPLKSLLALQLVQAHLLLHAGRPLPLLPLPLRLRARVDGPQHA